MKRLKRYSFVFLLFISIVIIDCLLFSIIVDYAKQQYKKEVDLAVVWEDSKYFPVAESTYSDDYTLTYVDSWLQGRSYGGNRVHEGCDLMASENVRGHYPIVSISDGVVEQLGWLKLGGYRIGIRSPGGVYFYYAHLSDYASELTIGDSVKAGELLGFMGDTGYSEIEGTTGNFPVHLHLGIYLNDENGDEKAYNPYPFLLELEKNKIQYYFE